MKLDTHMQNDMYPKVLGVDYGTKRIGVAVSYGTLAEPLMVINNADSEKTDNHVVIESALHEIAGICQVEGAIEIVVGVSEQAMADKTAKFAKILQDFTHLPVCLTDETLSSQRAEQKLREAQAPRRKRSGKIDHFSAALILEEWLETKQA